ncbi:hypothetical protein UlMin_033231 [Ulmus minor]
MSGTNISSPGSGSGQKVSMFAAKSGFIIPKNKLAGSLVPVFRGAKKLGVTDSFSGESPKQFLRKTKWGPDLTQDAGVRRGRALAYQTRMDQITQQLKSGIGEMGDNGGSELATQSPDDKSSRNQSNSEKLEQLELEKREVIEELLKLNPNYKAPSGYKPLVKEDRVPLPVKEFSGYNFVGLILGHTGENQKQLEKETGAKIKVYRKKEQGGQVEIKPSDWNEPHSSCEELYVHISADTYEKVDAAVSVIEVLITSVSGNLAAASTTSKSDSRDDVNMMTSAPVSSSLMQPMARPIQAPPQGQFLYPTSSWFPAGPPNMALHSPSGFIPPNSTLFGPQPTPVAGFNLVPHDQSLISPTQLPPNPYMGQTNIGPIGPPRNPSPMTPPQFSSVQANNIPSPLPNTGSQLPPKGVTWPFMPSLPQPVSSHITQMAPRSQVPTHPPSNISTSISVSPQPQMGHLPPLAVPTPLGPSVSMTQTFLMPPSSGDFTFQPHRLHDPASQIVPRPSNQFASQLPMPNLSQPANHMFSRPLVGNLMGQPQSPYARNPTAIPVPSRPPFPEASSITPRTPIPQMGMRNLGPGLQMPNLPGPFHPRPGNQGQLQHNYSVQTNRSETLLHPNQQFVNNLPFASGRTTSIPGEQQLYDPFSPTSMSIRPQHQRR